MEDLNSRMLFHVERMIGKRAEQILKKLKVWNPELKFPYSQEEHVENKIIGETSYFELQR
jgi:hypothetical protein